MRIPSGVTDQYIYFVAVDATDFTTRETGLSSFTVYRSRNGGAAAAMTTPTINETDATNMPGVYELLLDEDMTIDSGDDTQEMAFHITHAGMAPVTRTIELYRPKITAGNTLSVESDGDLTEVNTLTGHTAQTGDNFARLGAPAGASVSADIAAIEAQTDDIGAAGAGLTAIPWNAAWDAEVESEVDDALGAGGADLTAVPWNAAWDAEVQSEVNDALVALGLDHLLGASVAGTDITDDSIIAQLVSASATADWDDFDNTTDSLQAIRDRGDAAWTTGAGSGLSPLASGTAQAGTASTIQLAAGETFADNELNGNIVKITGGTGAGQARLITAYTGSTDTATVTPNWTTNPSSDSVYEVVEGSVNVEQIERTDATDQIRDAVVDDATRIDASALNTASTAIGSDGTGLTEAGGDGDHLTEAGGTGDQLTAVPWNAAWDTEVESEVDDALGVGGADLTAIPWNASWDAEVQSEVNDALVALGLDHLLGASVTGTDVTDNSIIARLVSASATADWDDFVNTTDSLQALRDHVGDGTNLTEAGGDGDHLTEAGGDGDHLTEAGATGDHLTAVPWNASWDAEVQSEVNDALNETIAEITGASDIPATPTIRQALMLLYMVVRNANQSTASERRVMNDAGTEVLDATMSDDGTTFDQGELGDA